MNYTSLKTPGVYVNEISIFPPSVAQVPTAIPGFIGFTERAELPTGETLRNKPTKISSFVEFQLFYGSGPPLAFDKIELDSNGQVAKASLSQTFYLYDSIQMFFANGGGDCYITSIGDYSTAAASNLFTDGIDALAEADEPTMIVFPDAVSLTGTGLYDVQQHALTQCGNLMDRVGVFDIPFADKKMDLTNNVKSFRDSIGMSNLKYGAAYAPWISVAMKKDVHFRDVYNSMVTVGTNNKVDLLGFVKGLSPADTATIQGTISSLTTIVADRKKMNDLVADYLKAVNFIAYAPIGLTKDQPSLEQLFNVMVTAVRGTIANAQASPVATQPAKIDSSAVELMKLVKQIFNLAKIINDFANPANVTTKKLLDKIIDTIKLVAGPAPQNAGATYNLKLIELANWDENLKDNVAKLIANNAPPSVRPAAFDIYNLPAGAAAAVVPNPGNDAGRIANQTDAVNKLADLFNYFNDIVTGILSFASDIEKSSEDTLITTWPVYKAIIDSVSKSLTKLPPSGAVAGIYARVDNERGVWKAPANVSVTMAKGTTVNITDNIQDGMNVDVDAGKSVNAIRAFTGKGVMVWGARTLAGNDNEWRYISVRRFFNMVEESVKKSTAWVVFEPNDANTWIKVKGMIENYLTLLWREGALAGSKPDEAFRVYVGLNQTMTSVDILEGRMIIRIEMAAVRPAEFIVLEFAHKLQTS